MWIHSRGRVPARAQLPSPLCLPACENRRPPPLPARSLARPYPRPSVLSSPPPPAPSPQLPPPLPTIPAMLEQVRKKLVIGQSAPRRTPDGLADGRCKHERVSERADHERTTRTRPSASSRRLAHRPCSLVRCLPLAQCPSGHPIDETLPCSTLLRHTADVDPACPAPSPPPHLASTLACPLAPTQQSVSCDPASAAVMTAH